MHRKCAKRECVCRSTWHPLSPARLFGKSHQVVGGSLNNETRSTLYYTKGDCCVQKMHTPFAAHSNAIACGRRRQTAHRPKITKTQVTSVKDRCHSTLHVKELHSLWEQKCAAFQCVHFQCVYRDPQTKYVVTLFRISIFQAQRLAPS